MSAISALTFSPPNTYSQEVALNGNLAANRLHLSTTVTGISWPAGHMLMIRWRDSDSTGADDALAIDDVAFFAPTSAVTPEVISTVPAAPATGVPTSSRLSVVFNQPVTTSGSWAQLVDENAAAVPVTFSGGPIRYEITPVSRLLAGKNYTLTIQAALVTNPASTPMVANVVRTFTTQAALVNPRTINAVQGSGLTTPFSNQVVTVTGVVTANFQGPPPALAGFFMQSLPADDDSNAATSEGLFVSDFTSEGSGPVAVGDVVTVTGTAGESSSLTQISNVTALAISGSATLPAFSDAALPQSSGSALEPLEGMRVRFLQTLHVTSTNTSSNFVLNYPRNGELSLSSSSPLVEPTETIDPNDNPASGTTSSGTSNVAAVTAQATANSLRTLVLDDASSAVYPDPTPYLNAQGTRRCGDTVTALSGILSYSGGRYRVQPVAAVVFVDSNPRPLSPQPLSGRLRVASMNVLNYFTTFGGANDRGANSMAEFDRQKAKIIAALVGLNADVLGLIEIQNTTAAVNDLLAALNAAVGGSGYQVVPDPVGGPGGDAIRCVWLYKSATIRLFGPCYADNHDVWKAPNPLRLPLAQVFEEKSTGERFIGCLNHWKSKSTGGASGANADQGDGQGAWNDLRRQQAARLHVWLQSVSAAVGDQDVLIVGDLNSYGEEDPLDVLRASGYADQSARFQPNDYSYRLAETRGRLDHAFASTTMATQVMAVDHWHINADEPAFYDYNLESKTAAQQLVNVGTPFRSSDHDPVLMGVSLSPQPTTYAMWTAAQDWPVGVSTDANADAEADGIKNLVEYILNSNPLIPDTLLSPTALVLINGQFQLTYRRRTNASGVTVLPEWSTNLLQWFSMTESGSVPIDSLTDLRTATVPVAGQTQLFGRLRVEISP